MQAPIVQANQTNPITQAEAAQTSPLYTKEEQQWLAQNPNIRIAHLSIWRQHRNLRNLHVDLEYLELLNRYGGLNLTIIDFDSWAEAYSSVLEGRLVQGILYLSHTQERENHFNFLPPYFYIPTYLIVRNDEQTIQSLDDLENKRVFSLIDSVTKNIIEDTQLDVEIIPVKRDQDAIQDLGSSQPTADAVVLFDYDQDAIKRANLTVAQTMYTEYGEVHLGLNNQHPMLYSILLKAHAAIPKQELTYIQNLSYISFEDRGKSLNLTKEEEQYLQFKRDITMCVDPDWEPYERITKQGEHVGLAADFIELISQKIGKPFRLIPTTSWQQSLEYAKQGRCETLSFLNQTPQRDTYLDFTSILYDEGEVIIAKENASFLRGYESLKGKKVGVIKGHNTDEYIQQNHPSIEIVYVQNYEDGIRRVSDGEIFATITAHLGAAHNISKLKLSNIKIAGETHQRNALKMGVVKDEPHLASILTKAIDTITQQERNRILANWVSVRFEQTIDYSLIWKILAVITSVLIFFFYRQYDISKINKKLKKEMEQQYQDNLEKDRLIFQQSKLVAMGEMIENIAHQWRQPLASINASVMTIDNLAHESGFHSDKLEGELAYMEGVAEHMSQTLDNFRNFLSKDNKAECFSLAAVIDESLSITHKTLENDQIEINLNLEGDLKIFGNKVDFMQVILVLINNAKDALENQPLSPKKLTISAQKHKDIIRILFKDNGGGIPENLIEKIFDPYFTTKHKAQGTGIGLYITKLIIEKKMGGTITASSKEQGACFNIELKDVKCE
ncbi:transporter substrate-binding domain-containing protein [Thiomicrospira microaerophila]|uniref:transporter substrate-binding domain-containing protein n=1 Tax=Thiomicrospira microaerophila TaxID=406020 RepID=UPI0018E0A7F1|nr:transporter substrate-binding domain-containing protein [Thiomicrospira microaerophila]